MLSRARSGPRNHVIPTHERSEGGDLKKISPSHEFNKNVTPAMRHKARAKVPSLHKHAIAVRIKAVTLPYRMAIGRQHPFFSA